MDDHYLNSKKSRLHFAFPVLHCVIFSHTPVLCLETLLKIDFATISYPSNIEPKTNSIPSGFFVNVIHSAWIFPTSRPVRLNHTCAKFLLFQIKLRYSQQKHGSHVHSFGKILLPTHFRGLPRISARLLFSWQRFIALLKSLVVPKGDKSTLKVRNLSSSWEAANTNK